MVVDAVFHESAILLAILTPLVMGRKKLFGVHFRCVFQLFFLFLDSSGLCQSG